MFRRKTIIKILIFLQLYLMDQSVLGISLRSLRTSDDSAKSFPDLSDISFKEDTRFIPIKILSKNEFAEKDPKSKFLKEF